MKISNPLGQQTVHIKGGINFLGALFLLFLALKLTGHIDWSWWWVFAPLWGPPAFAISLFLIVLVFALIFCRKKLFSGGRIRMRRI